MSHSTSKLRDQRGLEAIGTLGFRGEALAAIASVSRVELMTRERGAQEGVSLTLEGGAVTSRSPAGCPEGTTMIVRDLFFNTPARLKFMKTDRRRGRLLAAVLRSRHRPHPGIFRYIREWAGGVPHARDGRMDSCINSLFGREFAAVTTSRTVHRAEACLWRAMSARPTPPGATAAISFSSSTAGT
jgi:DNA mismatch repair protein MutL